MVEQVNSKKRDQIARSNKAMFVWVAAMSAVVGICLVVSYFLWQQIAFRTKVVDEKYDTVSTLKDNNNAVEELKKNIRLLETNAALGSAKADPEEKSLQVVLDALPADNNAAALGSSLQQKLVNDIPNLSLKSLIFDESEVTASSDEISNTTEVLGAQPISFTAVFESTDPNSLKDLLLRFERSIRVIDIDSLKVERSGNNYTMTVTAHGYYLPGKNIELKEKVVKP